MMNHTKLSSIRGLARVTALIAATGTLLALAAAAASAATTGPIQGNNACTVTAGTMSFSPALSEHGNGNRPYVSLKLQLGNCSQAAARGGTFTGSPSFFLANDSCRSLFSAPPPADPVSGSILWRPRSANRSTDISFTGRSESAGPSVRFALSGGTAYGGSFDGTAKSRFSLKETDAQINAACGSPSGLAQLTVKSGYFKEGPGAAIVALPRATSVPADGARAGAAPAAAEVTGTRASLTAVAAIPGSTGAWAVGETCPKGPEGCTPGNDLVLRDSGGGWSAVPAPSPGGPASLVAVSADSSSDAWAVGSYDGGEKNLYLHWTGGSWKRVTGPSNITLTGVTAISPADALAVGYGTSSTGATVTVALHWNGTSWTQVHTPDPGGAGDDELLGVTAIPGTADAWAVGYSLTPSSEYDTLVLHWNGSAFSRSSAPAVATDGTQLNAVTAVSANDAWAVGQYNTASDFEHPVILHWDGTAWSQQKLPSFGQSVYMLNSVAATASNVWAVGLGPCLGGSINCPSKTLTMHLTSSGWQAVPGVSISDQQNQNNLAGVAITSGGTTWAVGDYFPAAYGEPIFTLLEEQQGSGWITK